MWRAVAYNEARTHAAAAATPVPGANWERPPIDTSPGRAGDFFAVVSSGGGVRVAIEHDLILLDTRSCRIENSTSPRESSAMMSVETLPL